ncbi:HrpT family type III secretion system protein [Pokkaliibacter sp. CJK22405]|uniref:HrpT family type III secretion system protein n=1 Tax=Pokkaliibacter sp. CJK22405 TaxID=3384615 RepID=UPI0039852CBC
MKHSLRLTFAALMLAALAGCSSIKSDTQCAGLCGRPLSTPQKMVIWWPQSMRDSVNSNEEITVYTFNP